jgi:hypothetical protein
MLPGVLLLLVLAAIIAAVGYTYGYLTSPPPAASTGFVPALRRSLHAKTQTRAAFCAVHSDRLAEIDGYCSSECRESDAEAQAVA